MAERQFDALDLAADCQFQFDAMTIEENENESMPIIMIYEFIVYVINWRWKRNHESYLQNM